MNDWRSVDTIVFFDEGSKDEACVILRRWQDKVILGVSLKADGDVEVTLSRANAERLLGSLKDALRDE